MQESTFEFNTFVAFIGKKKSADKFEFSFIDLEYCIILKRFSLEMLP